MLRIAPPALFALSLLLGAATTAQAQRHQEGGDSPVVIITAPDAQPGAAFGTAISASGDRLLVGAPLHNTTAGTNAGQAYLFDPDGKHLHTVSAPDGHPHACFGFAVAALDEVVAVGAGLHDTDEGNDAGQVYLFAADGAHLATVAAPDGHALAQFGFALAAVGDRLLVGAHTSDTDAGSEAGRAYLFSQDGKVLDTFESTNAKPFASFGQVVRGWGNDVVVGAPRAAESAGRAYVFQRPVGTEPPAERRTPALEAPFPNPAARSATVAFTLPTGSDARLELFDVLGRRVAVLADGPHAAGRHVLTLDAAGLAGGVYVLRLTAGRHAAARRVSVTR